MTLKTRQEEIEAAWEAFKEANQPVGASPFYYNDNRQYFFAGYNANPDSKLLDEAIEALEFYTKGWIEENVVIELNPKVTGTTYLPLFSLRNDHGNKARETLQKIKQARLK